MNHAPSPRRPVAPSPRRPIAPSPRRPLLFLFVSLWFAFPIASAQTGEIAGRVVTEDGAVAPNVMVFLNAGARESRVQSVSSQNRTSADEDGYFKFTGLATGSYMVNDAAGSFPMPYDGEHPTYHPSSTRDTAVEVKVAAGEEVSGIDIRHRGDRGSVISGVVSGGGETEKTAAVSVTLFDTRAKTSAGSSFIQPGGARGFAFNGMPDGEYVLTARTTNAESNWASAPRRVTLSGRDATGLELRLLPLGSISGRVVVESLREPCGEKSQVLMENFSVTANRDDARKDDLAFLPGRFFSSQRANEKGEFTIDNVDPGNYRLGTRVFSENHYIKAITSPSTAPARRGASSVNDISRNGLALKQGEKLSGVTLTIAEGAASLQGKVVAEKEGERLPAPPGELRALLIPAEPNAVDNVLRYAEAPVRNNGEFAFSNITPGKYWLITRIIPGADPNDRPPGPVAWDANERAKLRREAQAAKYEIDIQPCGHVKDFVLRFVR